MKENKILYGFLKIIYSSLVTILYNPKVYGKENIPKDGPVVFAGNHRHAFDPVVVMTHTKRFVHYMAKETIFKGLHGLILKEMGLIKVYRTRNNPKAIEDAEKVLTRGGTVGLFPEGTRNKTEEELLKFKHGAVVIAKNTNTPIVPFYINGKYKVFRKGLELHFGNPIDVSNMTIEEANNYLREEVLKLSRK
mgnify:FL=1